MRRIELSFSPLATTLWVGLLSPGQPTSAQDGGYGATAKVEAPVAATNREDATASGSAIDLTDRTLALQEVPDALVKAPGLRLQQFGGAGSFVGVSLRGAEVGHTSVMVNGIPLNSPDTGPFDFGVLPINAWSQVEVFRGGAPAWYSEGAIGGVVNFTPLKAGDDTAQATAGVGSFGLAEFRGSVGLASYDGLAPAGFGHLRLQRADNDYAYVDDGQTRFDESDDRVLQQQNAEISAGDLYLHGGIDALGGRATFLFLGHARDQGIPGPLAAPTRFVNRKLYQALAGAAYELEKLDSDGERAYRLQLVLSGNHQVNQLRDLRAELGTSRQVDSNDIWQRGHLRLAGSLRVLSFLETTMVLTGSTDFYRPENPAAFTNPPRASDRYTGAATFEPRLFGRPFGIRAELRPSVRLAVTETSISANRQDGVFTQTQSEHLSNLRLAGTIEPISALALSSSISTGTRLPSISELFGDRVYQLPNPDLLPETSTTADVSAVVRGRWGDLRGSIELRGFGLWIEDLIRYRRTAQYTVIPENVSSSDILGVEAGVQAQYGRHLDLAASLTAMQTRNQFDKALPLRRPLEFLIRPTTHLYYGDYDRVSLFAQLYHASFAYVDDANLSHIPERTVFDLGATASFFSELLAISGRLTNLTDQQVVDVLSRPLPGRAFKLSLTVKTEAYD